ncbi:sporulation protein, YlmC/YmxH family [Syntrophobotulus glycolicus DSM 8271]|uniref:Sporulation protein, YlmC/YmxH family n=1 Tax=Syntrophobotulus glycolicus (strain DSM 8271 / FlGlyR) TaxID=645991 RepID=F0T008_SYNGF|nr:YlmC/YmxH family sporulation protein [Syntrophobotulus glycolicus]ADY55019.1 sporulation protein, YlmC/YmxH family [Syntrophobotulus glycolicus DSM 8271]
MKVSEMRMLDIINVEDGRRLGPILDLDIDLEKGIMKGLVVMVTAKGRSFFGSNRGGDAFIPWERVVKIGVDVILVDAKDIVSLNG